ncbi:MAG: glycosyltransferase family protein [Acidobacteriota bacterium]
MSDVARPRVVCIVEARFRSSRLPGKVTKPILGLPMLARMIERVSRARTLDAVVIACPVGTDDDAVEEIAFETGVFCFRGSEDDVLARVVGAAEANRADVIVELTGDCPLHEPALIDKVVADYQLGGADFVSNILPYTTPRGTDVRVFSAVALADIAKNSTDAADREHVSLRFWEHPEKYTRRNVVTALPEGAKDLRLTVDTEDDFRLVTAIYEELYPKNAAFTLSDVIALLDARPDLRSMNEHVQQKTVR